MTMFQFQPQDGPQVVSSWIWLYFVVTFSLTAAVFGLWRYFAHRAKKDYKNLLMDVAAAGKHLEKMSFNA